MALLVVAISIVAPGMSRFIRGRALNSESRRLAALMHAGQSRAVSEGMPMMLWVDAKNNAYGLEAETSSQTGQRAQNGQAGQSDDPKAEMMTVDSTLQIAVLNVGTGAAVTFKNLPAIRFLPDGTVDQGSPQSLQLQDADGFTRWLLLDKLSLGYEISDTAQ
jgi:Tfp pilus assembly protein FimT